MLLLVLTGAPWRYTCLGWYSEQATPQGDSCHLSGSPGLSLLHNKAKIDARKRGLENDDVCTVYILGGRGRGRGDRQQLKMVR